MQWNGKQKAKVRGGCNGMKKEGMKTITQGGEEREEESMMEYD